MRYVVQHPYRARRDGQDFGPWAAGDEVELTEPDAEWVNRDSPGCLRALYAGVITAVAVSPPPAPRPPVGASTRRPPANRRGAGR